MGNLGGCRCRWDIGLHLWEDCSALVGDLCYVATISVDGVGHLLDSAVRKVGKVRSRGNGPISLLVRAKVGSRVVVGNGVCVGVDRGLISVGNGLLWPAEAGAGQGRDDEQDGLHG